MNDLRARIDEVKISKRVEFDAGHRLPGNSKCANVHGHRFALEATVSGKITDGMIIDFSDLKQMLMDEVVAHWDHAFFVWRHDQVMIDFLEKLPNHRTVVTPEPPTAEYLAARAFELLDLALAEIEIPVRLESVRLYETPNSWAEANRS